MPAITTITSAIRGLGKPVEMLTAEGKVFLEKLMEFFRKETPSRILTKEAEARLGRPLSVLIVHMGHMSDIFLIQFAKVAEKVLPSRAAQVRQLFGEVVPVLKRGKPEEVEKAMKRIGEFFNSLEPQEQYRMQLFFHQFSIHMEADTAPVRGVIGKMTRHLHNQSFDAVVGNRMVAAAKEVDVLIGTMEKAASKAGGAVHVLGETVNKIVGSIRGTATALRAANPKPAVLNQAGKILSSIHGMPAEEGVAKNLFKLLTERHTNLKITELDIQMALEGKLTDPTKLQAIHQHTAHLLDEGIAHVRDLEVGTAGLMHQPIGMTSDHFQQLGHGMDAIDDLAKITQKKPLKSHDVLKHHRELVRIGADPLSHVQSQHAARSSVTGHIGRAAEQRAQRTLETAIRA